MRNLVHIFRLFQISLVLVSQGCDEIILAVHLFRPIRFIYYLFPWNWRGRDGRPLGLRIRLALEELGPIFIKFGQVLSTRRDLLPPEIADELAKLQDKVPPFPGSEAREIIEQALNQSLEEAFLEFHPEPFASASVAQVHAARLHTGADVVVKVLRPGMEKKIARDIAVLEVLAIWASRYSKEARRFRPREMVAEFKRAIGNECDLVAEAANTSVLRRNFLNSPLLYVPEVHWPAVKKNVLVMERVYGVPVSDLKTLKEKGVNIKKLAEQGVEIFFTQVFRDCFFHADMHPGNIFVSLTNREAPQYVVVDCGIVGTLSSEDQHYLAANFLAFFRRDYRWVAELHIESGWVPRDTRVEEFEAEIRTLSEPVFEKPLGEISFAQLLFGLFQAARRFQMNIQPQLILLQKTLFNIEGLGRELYPELDLWSTAKPYLEKWMKRRLHPKTWFKLLSRESVLWTDKMARLPIVLIKFLEDEQRIRASLEKEAEELRKMNQAMQQLFRYQMVGIVMGMGLLGIMTILIFF
ncbi:MAG: ubiquinone biosynthesis regulatory protein kinase UbiB [Gammaproteobacteria bacterium]|nr:ubiquinone biosynthesis regulatory protein kinase UbiB [Gammaproteobacteria bacterium]